MLPTGTTPWCLSREQGSPVASAYGLEKTGL
jgi:hypothetical protein